MTTDTAPTFREPSAFLLDTPGDWIVIDLEGLTDRAAVAARVDVQIDAWANLAEHRDELIEMVIGAGESARASGTLFAAMLAVVGPTGSPVVANVTVATVEDPTLAANGQPPVDAPGNGPAAGPGDDGSDPAPELALNAVDAGDGSTRLTPVRVELPAGPSLRTERIVDAALPGGGSLRCLTVQHTLAIPATVDRFVVLTFTTPSLAVRDDMTEIFAEVAASFAWA